MRLRFCSYLFDPKIYEKDPTNKKEKEWDEKKKNRIKHKIHTVHYGLV
jgi:hypothetical protein